MSDLHNELQKAIQSAEQAVAEDKANNLEAAMQHYITAIKLFMQAMKNDSLKPDMKEKTQSKIHSFLARAQEIKEDLKNDPTKRKVVTDTANSRENSNDVNDDPEKRCLMQTLAEHIISDPKLTFADVVGLEHAKETLKEAVILPVKFPQLFQGRRKLYPGILLYGAPGTGKSYLAKAIAAECQATFISVSSWDFVSRYYGNNEKRIQYLFELARDRQPCIVFIDDIDALCEQRTDGESESHRRIKTEFLVRIEGIRTGNANVFILAATHSPWELDAAIRRRFEKRIYIPLPGVNERAAMFKIHLGVNTHHEIKDHEWMELAEKSEYYSAADITVACREAILRPIRRLRSATHFKRVPNSKSDGPQELWIVCSPEDPLGEPLTVDKIEPDELYEPPVTMSDMLGALATQKPSIQEADLMLHKKFTEEFGAEG